VYVPASLASGISTRTLYNHLELWHPIHYQSGSCKTIQPETISAILEPEFEDPPKSLEPCKERRFYTEERDMKGRENNLFVLPDQPSIDFEFFGSEAHFYIAKSLEKPNEVNDS
jgi:hypothetical protein